MCVSGLLWILSHHERWSTVALIHLVFAMDNHLITLAPSDHKMARGSLPTMEEEGRLLARGGEHSGHGMLGTATA